MGGGGLRKKLRGGVLPERVKKTKCGLGVGGCCGKKI